MSKMTQFGLPITNASTNADQWNAFVGQSCNCLATLNVHKGTKKRLQLVFDGKEHPSEAGNFGTKAWMDFTAMRLPSLTLAYDIMIRF